MFEIEELKSSISRAKTIQEHAASYEGDEPTVVLRDYDEPTTPPFLEAGVEVFDFAANPRPLDDVRNAFGTRGNIPGMEVVKALKAALGGGFVLHISDGSYTAYSVWELREFITNFDNTNLRVWIAETFDCDDFSQVLQGSVNRFFPGIAFGTVWYGPKGPGNWGHSVNVFYSYFDKKVYLVEPQADSFYFFDKTRWQAWMAIM